MRVVVDYDRCESHARCMELVPEVFNVDADDQMHVLQDRPPATLRAQIERAVELCPKQALSLQESS